MIKVPCKALFTHRDFTDWFPGHGKRSGLVVNVVKMCVFSPSDPMYDIEYEGWEGCAYESELTVVEDK